MDATGVYINTRAPSTPYINTLDTFASTLVATLLSYLIPGGYEAFNLFRLDQGSSSSSTTSSSGDDAGEYENLLSLHNKNRCMHNADPLTWDSDIYNTAKVW